jgi:hypothetical protein
MVTHTGLGAILKIVDVTLKSQEDIGLIVIQRPPQRFPWHTKWYLPLSMQM